LINQSNQERRAALVVWLELMRGNEPKRFQATPECALSCIFIWIFLQNSNCCAMASAKWCRCGHNNDSISNLDIVF